MNSNINKIEYLKEHKYNNSNPKKKKYRTLLDILKKRQNSEPKINNKKEKNDLNKTKNPLNNKILKIFPVPKRSKQYFKYSKKIKDNYFDIYKNKFSNKNYNQNNETNKDSFKLILDTSNNSTSKTSINKEGTKIIFFHNDYNHDNENNFKSKNFSYKVWEYKRKVNNNEEKNKNLFHLYKNNNHKLIILNSRQNNSNENINFMKTENMSIDKNKNSFFSFSHLKNANNENKTTFNSNSNHPTNIKENNFLLYSDRSHNDICLSSEEKNNNTKIINKTKESSYSFNSGIKSPKSQTFLDEKDYEKNDIIKDFVINSSNKKIFRESLNLHEICRKPSIFITQEKLKNLSNKTKIPFFDENNYNYINLIGEGTYGSVYLVENNETLEQYALKKIICRDYIELIKQKDELELIYSIKHENILNIYGIQFKYLDETTSSIQILMELAKSDWDKEIKKRTLAKKYYKENEIINLLKQIVNGLLFLQNKNIVHRDIKPQNILLFPKNIYKIADFGEAKYIKNIKEQTTLKGSELFMSPILYKGYKLNQKSQNHNPFKSDVFSLGYCTLYAMCLNLNILNDLRELTTMKSIINCINKYIMPNLFSNKLINLIYKMIEPNEDLRYDFEYLSNELQLF